VATDLLARQQAGPARVVGSGVPRALDQMVAACLAADPARRPTAEALKRQLYRFVRRRVRWAWWALVTTVVVGGSLAGWLATRPAAAHESGPVATATPPVPALIHTPPRTADDHVARGFKFAAEGDADRAFDEFVAAHTHRKDGWTLALMGYAQTLAGKHDKAVGHYWQAIDEFHYNEAWVRNNRAYGMIRIAVNSPPALGPAIAEAEAALRLDPDLRAARFNRAYGRFFQALDPKSWTLPDPAVRAEIDRDLEPFLRDGPGAPDLYFLAAQVEAASGGADLARLAAAVTHLRRAVELGYPARMLSYDPVFSRHLGGRTDFRAVLAMPAALPPNAPVNLALAHPPGR